MATQKRGTQIFPSQKRVRRQYHHHHHHGYSNSGGIRAYPSVNLPDDVFDGIISFLPVKQAIQIGITSKRFKKSWMLTRKLFFDREFARGRPRPDFISIVTHVLDLHEGPNIDSFRLYFDPTGVGSIVESWIKKCIEKGVEELDFDFVQAREAFEIKSDLLDVESIKILKLSYCKIELPPKLKGLRFLNTLVLKNINVSMKLIASLFTNCLFLETFDITQCYINYLQIYARNLKRFKVLKVGVCQDMDRIDIDAPTLHTLYYCGGPCVFKIGDVSLLNNVMLNILPSRTTFAQHFKVGNLVSDFSHIQVLTTSSTFVEALCARYIDGQFTNLQYCFWNLKELQLFMEGASYCNLYDVASFLRNCLCIEKVFIDLNDFSFEGGYYWELHQRPFFDHDPRLFHCLKFVKIKGFKFQKYEVELVKYFLEKAICLETLVLVTPKNNKIKVYAKDVLLYDRIFHFWKASKRATMFMYENFDDRSPISPLHSKSWD